MRCRRGSLSRLKARLQLFPSFMRKPLPLGLHAHGDDRARLPFTALALPRAPCSDPG